MIATARITYDRDYFQTHYDEWLNHRSKLKKYEVWYYAAFILFGCVLTAIYYQKWYMGSAIAAYGAYQLMLSLSSKKRWVDARLRSAAGERTIELQFEREKMFSKSPHGTAEILFAAFCDFTVATHGFFLVPDNGVSIYVPRSAVDPPDSYLELTSMLSTVILEKTE